MLTFDEEKHEYRLAATGAVVPGVTSVLQDVFRGFDFVKPEALAHAQLLGNAVHKGCELYSQGVLDWSSLHPAVEPRLKAYLKFLEREQPTILWSEQPVYHPLHRYAGKPDAGVALHGARGIIDFKTGFVSMARVGPQTAAYLAAKNQEVRSTLTADQYALERYERRWALQLRDDGDYRLHECTDLADEAVFYSCLNIFRWRQKHGLTSR